MSKIPVVCPAGMTMLAGTVATAELDVNATSYPPTGAGPFRVTVPTDPIPPFTDVGVSDTLTGLGASTRIVVIALCDAVDALTITVERSGVGTDVTCTLADVCPSATVTVAGTGNTVALSVDKFTTVPPVGAGPSRVTESVTVSPPMTVRGVALIRADGGIRSSWA
jgi:hypothetical protein